MRRWKLVLFGLGGLAGLQAGWSVLSSFRSLVPFPYPYALFLALAGGFLLGGVGTYLLALLAVRLVRLLTARFSRFTLRESISGVVGLILGLLVAFLASPALTRVPVVGYYLPLPLSVFFGYLGWTLGVQKNVASLFPIRPRREGGGEDGRLKILDTSAIIDGRVVEVIRAGFLEGKLLVPGFVVEELRILGDSGDAVKRARGRRGLEILKELQEELGPRLKVQNGDGGKGEVDLRLLRLARRLKAKIVSTDNNLLRVASLRGIPTLNLNRLAEALRPQVLPGEGITLHLLREGKEAGQGVGYLPDGTMVVVEGGKRYIGEEVEVEVTSVLQTSSGRIIFSRPRSGVERLKTPVYHS